jgi:hypothetical protein
VMLAKGGYSSKLRTPFFLSIPAKTLGSSNIIIPRYNPRNICSIRPSPLAFGSFKRTSIFMDGNFPRRDEQRGEIRMKVNSSSRDYSSETPHSDNNNHINKDLSFLQRFLGEVCILLAS